ncbi:MAG: DUF134 domain-containing protein [Candidatus Thorarchaeota archaeon]|nr:MAG: DUF134 domain-containing protein [Candidatus Thorarchaeota archaeon]
MMRGRRRRGRLGRMPHPVMIGQTVQLKSMTPDPEGNPEPVYLEPAELEVIRLVDIEDLNQQDAGERMDISRGTIWRLLQSGRRKIALALIEGRRIEIL